MSSTIIESRWMVTATDGQFIIRELNQGTTFGFTKQAAWLKARAQAQPVTVYFLDGKVTRLGVVTDPKAMRAATTIITSPAPRQQQFGETTSAVRPPAEIAEVAVYSLDGVIYRVKPNRERTRSYAQRWNVETETWDFVPGMVYKLKPEHKVTLAQVQEFGSLYSRCIRCNRRLTNKESVLKSIGPICRRELGL